MGEQPCAVPTHLPYPVGMSRRRRWSGGWAWWGCRGRPVSRLCRWPHSGPRCSSPSRPSFGRFRPQDGTASHHRCRRKLLGAECQHYGAGTWTGAPGPGCEEGCPLLTVRGIGTLHAVLSADTGDRRKGSRRARCPLACAGGQAGRSHPAGSLRPGLSPEVTPSRGAFQPMSRGGGSRTFQATSSPGPLPGEGSSGGVTAQVPFCPLPSPPGLPPSSSREETPHGPPPRPRMGHPSGPEGRSPCWEAAGRIPHMLQVLAAPARLTRSSSSCPRAPWSLARRTGLQHGRLVVGMGSGMKPHIASGPRRRWGPLVGTWGSSLRARET